MQIRKIMICNFRGIKRAEWLLSRNRFVCLVGPGDSTKTTLLDAIGLVLSSRWNISFSDADFYGCNVDLPIVLQVVVGDLPPQMLRDDTLGYDLSGFRPDGTLLNEPDEGCESCLIIQLRVTDTLEPVWTVVRPDGDDQCTIGVGARERFGLFRVDERIETHLRWGRGSALTRLTASKSGAEATVISAHRAARDAVFAQSDGPLHEAAAEVAAAAAAIGGAAFTNLRPGLDPAGSSSTHALVLHDEEIPLTGHGLGTRRLISLAIQEKAFTTGEIILVDEIEYGLEPHRLHHLLRHLKKRINADKGQVIVTTHSPLAVEVLQAEDISVVRSSGEGETTVLAVPAELDQVQGTLRQGPSAVLGSRIIVCEGKTEMGVARRFLQHWDADRSIQGKAPHAALGACQTDGHGSTDAPRRAEVLARLGYPVLLVIDNDDAASDPGVATAKAAGAGVVRWDADHALEDEVAAALTPDGLTELVGLAAEIKSEQSVLNAVGDRLPGKPKIEGLDVSAWVDASRTIEQVRAAIGAAAKSKSGAWFKLEETGERLGELLIKRWTEIATSALGAGLRQLHQFAYHEELP
jgi:putative ATP-dependent endonuclease of the OLD family